MATAMWFRLRSSALREDFTCTSTYSFRMDKTKDDWTDQERIEYSLQGIPPNAELRPQSMAKCWYITRMLNGFWQNYTISYEFKTLSP
ncbi:hypothetical protein AVEN_263955-1 [Araneus ventricosus]|uniref:Uncharacterized protein n=1 Tax=Araneus ventricosus TaxID=182803 RepID=A0A4Y2HNP8_ARAVE|nr:hypothetical protein AVEN_263955-1 [Araneus ventricosus]